MSESQPRGARPDRCSPPGPGQMPCAAAVAGWDALRWIGNSRHLNWSAAAIPRQLPTSARAGRATRARPGPKVDCPAQCDINGRHRTAPHRTPRAGPWAAMVYLAGCVGESVGGGDSGGRWRGKRARTGGRFCSRRGTASPRRSRCRTWPTALPPPAGSERVGTVREATEYFPRTGRPRLG